VSNPWAEIDALRAQAESLAITLGYHGWQLGETDGVFLTARFVGDPEIVGFLESEGMSEFLTVKGKTPEDLLRAASQWSAKGWDHP
jgi:hypothetical protein